MHIITRKQLNDFSLIHPDTMNVLEHRNMVQVGGGSESWISLVAKRRVMFSGGDVVL